MLESAEEKAFIWYESKVQLSHSEETRSKQWSQTGFRVNWGKKEAGRLGV